MYSETSNSPFLVFINLTALCVRKWLHAGEQTPPCHEKTPRRARVIKGVIRTPDKSGLDHYKGRPLRRLKEIHTRRVY